MKWEIKIILALNKSPYSIQLYKNATQVKPHNIPQARPIKICMIIFKRSK